MRKKVLIDVSSTIPRKSSYISGIGKSTLWLVNALNSIPPSEIPFDIELCAIGLKNLGFDFYNWRFKHHIIPVPKSLRFGSVNAPCIWRKLFINYDIYHIPGIIDYTNNKECFTSVFHDIDQYSITKNQNIKNLYRHVANNSKSIVCCSKYSKDEVVREFKTDPKKVKVIYWGCDRDLFRVVPTDTVTQTLDKYGIKRPYFFSCSCSNPRKNIITALKAFREFLKYEPSHCFVIAWGTPKQEILTEFAEEIKEGKLLFLPHISDEELVHLYNGASMSVYVTRKEGFGFPILESFSCGTPVMTCKNSCLQEIGQDAAIYVGEDDICSMVNVMLNFEKNNYDNNAFLSKNKQVLECFSWQKCAKEYIDFFNSILTDIK